MTAAETNYLKALCIYKAPPVTTTGVQYSWGISCEQIVRKLLDLYQNTKQYEKAIPYWQEELNNREIMPYKQDVFLLPPVHQLGYLYGLAGDHSMACNYFERALSLAERILAANHPNLVIYINNLAFCYCELGEYDKAKPLIDRAFVITKSLISPISMLVDQLAEQYAKVLQRTNYIHQAAEMKELAQTVRVLRQHGNKT